MFKFAHPEILYVLISIPAFVLLFLLAQRKRKKAIESFGDLALMETLMPEISKTRPVLKFILSMVALCILIFVIAGPQFGSKLQEVKRKGVEIVIALDVSNSMLAEDIQPNRLERAKRAISRLVDKLSNDKIGLIVFAGEAYTQIPITTDYVSAKMFLSSIQPNMVNKQGTAIGSAIELGMRSFTPESELNKALIIITDGENHEDDAIKAAVAAKEKGIFVHTIGMGDAKGAPIPLQPGSNEFIKDREGNTVISKRDEKMLQEIAISGGGLYIGEVQAGLRTLFDEINKMDKQEYESKIYTEFEDRFQYLTALVLLVLIFEFIILEKKNKWLKNIDLFDTNK